ncbi:gamma-aminobutyric acid type B receptor subunit 1-like [Amphiura filiformis]|uniref:gamma-aminobutyric acid type B receptor subunit 1-like n=1 Tax=Amphiura filiformis TaxID=82378 RepID=UPI003B21AE9A
MQVASTQMLNTTTSTIDNKYVTTSGELGFTTSAMPHNTPVKKVPLYLGGLFSLGGRSDESGHVPAVEMALDHINQRPDVLVEYDLRMVWNDTQCYSNLGSRMFIEQILNKPQKLLLIGPPCSTDAPNIAEVAHYWNLISVSYGAASPVLSDRKQYPYFFRTVTSTNVFFHLIIRLMREFGWKRVGTIHASYVSFGVIENFVSLVKSENFTIAASETFAEDPGIPLANIERHDAKIIYLAMFPDLARKIFCEAYKRDMTRGYVWIIYGWFPDLWWTEEDDTLECTVEEMNKAVSSSNILTVRRVQLSTKEDTTVANLTPQQLESQLRDRMEWPAYRNYTWIDDAPYSYDAVWAVALMLNKTAKALEEKTFLNGETSRLENFTYEDSEMAKMFFDILQQTIFFGMSGPVAFEHGDRLGNTMLGQLQGNLVSHVALYSIQDDSMEWISDILWQDDYIPIDHTAIVRKHLAISWYSYLSTSIVAGVCMLLAGFFLAFNIKNRALSIVKMSSPYLNNVIILGSLLIFTSVIVGGLDSDKVSRDIFAILCQVDN